MKTAVTTAKKLQRTIEFSIDDIRIRFESNTDNGFRQVRILQGNKCIATDWLRRSIKPTRRCAAYFMKKHTQYAETIDDGQTVYINLNLWVELSA